MSTFRSGSFNAIGSDGNRYLVHEVSKRHRVTSLSDREEVFESHLERYELTNGDHVNLNQDGTMEVVRTGVKLKRV